MFIIYLLCLIFSNVFCNNINKNYVQPVFINPYSRAGHDIKFWDTPSGIRLVIGAPNTTNTEDGINSKNFVLGEIWICDLDLKCEPVLNGSLPKFSSKYYSDEDELIKAFSKLNGYTLGFGESISTYPAANSLLTFCAPRYPWATVEYFRASAFETLRTPGGCFVKPSVTKDVIKMLNKPLTERYNGGSYNNYAYSGYGEIGFSVINIPNKKEDVRKNLAWLYFYGSPNSFKESGNIAKVLKPNSRVRTDNCVNVKSYGCPVKNFNYIGWDMTPMEKEEQLAVSAPASLLTRGTVHFTDENPNFQADVLEGEEYFAQFGASLTSGYLDGSDATDLVVGSPFSSYGEYESKNYLEDVGKIIIYYNPLHEPSKKSPKIIHGKESFGRFGSSVLIPGDLDKDGYQDLLVGAPYTQNGGTVYLFNGKIDGVSDSPSQVFEASEFQKVPTAFPEFGFSLAGKHDINQDGYDDFMIGAPGIGYVYIFRSSEIINLNINFTVPDPIVNFTYEITNENRNSSCFYIDLEISSDLDYELKYEITLDIEEINPRIFFKENSESRFESFFRSKNHQKQFTICLKKLSDYKETELIKTKLNITLDENNTSEKVPPILNPKKKSDYVQIKRTLLNIKQTIVNPVLHLDYNIPKSISAVSRGVFNMEATIAVSKDIAFYAEITFIYPSFLSFIYNRGSDVQCNDKLKENNETFSQVTCRADKTDAGKQIIYDLEFSYNSTGIVNYAEKRNSTKMKIDILWKSLNTQIKRNSTSVDIFVDVDPSFEGRCIPETVSIQRNTSIDEDALVEYMDHKNVSNTQHAAMGPNIKYLFTIYNKGNTTINEANILIRFTNSSINKKKVLNIYKINHEHNCYYDEKNNVHLDKLSLHDLDFEFKDIYQSFYTNQGGADSAAVPENDIRCKLYNIKSYQTKSIEIMAVILEANAIKLKMNSFSIEAQGYLSIVSPNEELFNNIDVSIKSTNVHTDVVILTPKEGLQSYKWQIIIAIVCGIIILLFLVLIMYLCGFFTVPDKSKLILEEDEDQDENQEALNPLNPESQEDQSVIIVGSVMNNPQL